MFLPDAFFAFTGEARAHRYSCSSVWLTKELSNRNFSNHIQLLCGRAMQVEGDLFQAQNDPPTFLFDDLFFAEIQEDHRVSKRSDPE